MLAAFLQMSYDEFVEVLQTITSVVKHDPYFSFLFSMRPVGILLIVVGIWIMAFVIVLIYLKDESKQSMYITRIIL